MMKPLGMAIGLAIALSTAPVVAAPKTDVTIASPWEVASFDPAVAGFAIQKLNSAPPTIPPGACVGA